MESNDNNAAQMLLFPIQEKPFEDCNGDYELITQLTLTFTKFVNQLRTGQINPTEEIIDNTRASVKRANEILIEAGHSPIDCDL